MADTTRSDVDAVYGDRAMSDSDADTLVTIANNIGNDIWGSRVARQGEVEGNEKDFKTYIAAHLWAIREGESQSESQAGGSVTYNFQQGGQGELISSLSETRFGRLAQTYIRQSASIGVEKTH